MSIMKKIKIIVSLLLFAVLTINATNLKNSSVDDDRLKICSGSGAVCFKILWGLIEVPKGEDASLLEIGKDDDEQE